MIWVSNAQSDQKVGPEDQSEWLLGAVAGKIGGEDAIRRAIIPTFAMSRAKNNILKEVVYRFFFLKLVAEFPATPVKAA